MKATSNKMKRPKKIQKNTHHTTFDSVFAFVKRTRPTPASKMGQPEPRVRTSTQQSYSGGNKSHPLVPGTHSSHTPGSLPLHPAQRQYELAQSTCLLMLMCHRSPEESYTSDSGLSITLPYPPR